MRRVWPVAVVCALTMCSACATWHGADCSAAPLVVVGTFSSGKAAIELHRHRRVRGGADAPYGLAWSADGRIVALQAHIPGAARLRLYVLHLDTGESHPVDRRRGFPRSMTWSGSYLLYTYDSTVDDALLLMSWNSRTRERASSDRPGLDRFRGFQSTISAPACLG